MTIREEVEELLKKGWYSNLQLQLFIRSSSADREARRIRENVPKNYEWKQRQRKIKGYNVCNEYHLEYVGE